MINVPFVEGGGGESDNTQQSLYENDSSVHFLAKMCSLGNILC